MEPRNSELPEKKPTTNQALLASLQLPLVQYLLLYMAVLCVFVPTFWYTYVWDDWAMVAKNESIREWKNIPSFFTDANTFSNDPKNKEENAWRPMRNVYFLLTYKMHGLHPAGWHFNHVLLHCLAAAMLLAFIRRLYRYKMEWPPDQVLPPAIQVATLLAVFAWAVHPANTEVTAWIKAGDDVLSCIFSVATLMVLFPIGSKVTVFRVISAALLFIVALLFKESVVPIPLIYIGLILLLAPNRRRALNHKPHWLAIILLFAVLVIFMGFRTLMLGKIEQAHYLAGSFSLMMATMTTAIIRYLQLTFWPFWPTVQIGDYIGWPMAHSWTEPRIVSSICILLIIAVIIAAISRRNRLFFAGWVIAALAFLPVANIIPMMQVLAERFMYFPLMGITLAVSSLWAWLLGRDIRWFWLPAAVCIALVITTHNRLPTWISEQNFQKSIVQAAPGSSRPTYNYALSLYEEGKTTHALSVMLSVMDTRPTEDSAILIAQILEKNGQFTSASHYLAKVQEAFPKGYKAYAMAGDLAYREKKTTEALGLYEKAIALEPDNPWILYAIGVTAQDVGETTRAVEAARKAVKVAPDWTSTTQLLQRLTSKTVTIE